MGILPFFLSSMQKAFRTLGFNKPFFFFSLAVSLLLTVNSLVRASTIHAATKESLSHGGGGVLCLRHRDFSTELTPDFSPEERLVSAVRRSKARKDRIEGSLLRKVMKAKKLSRGGYNYSGSKARREEKNEKNSKKNLRERASSAYRGVTRRRDRRQGGISASATSNNTSGDTSYALEMKKGDGAFLTSVYIGTPPKKASLIVDTGSDLVWQQCQPCESCYEQPADEPIFDPSVSSSFKKARCSDTLCQALLPAACLQSNSSCQYTYMYGDTSFTSGELAYDTLTLSDALGQKHLKIDGFAFGCGYTSRGASFGGSDGILGMGQGPISLASQLSSSLFSYCLSSFNTSQLTPLFLGDHAKSMLHIDNSSTVKVTPILRNPFMPTFYYLNLLGISIDGMPLNISLRSFLLKANGSGGMIIDSGTTITYLEEHGYRVVLNAVKSKITNQLQEPQPMFGLELCSSSRNESSLPTLTLHFENADMYLPPSNLFIHVGGFYCFALHGSHYISILGNIQQQNYQMVYDLGKQKLSFMQTSCDSM